MSARVYDFQLPYAISGIQDELGVDRLQAAGLWNQIPADLQQKMESGAGIFGAGAVVTKSDLDELPDPVWRYVSQQLGLRWHVASLGGQEKAS